MRRKGAHGHAAGSAAAARSASGATEKRSEDCRAVAPTGKTVSEGKERDEVETYGSDVRNWWGMSEKMGENRRKGM